MNRRHFLRGLITLPLAAPAIIRPGILMPIRPVRDPLLMWYKGVQKADVGLYYCPYMPTLFGRAMEKLPAELDAARLPGFWQETRITGIYKRLA